MPKKKPAVSLRKPPPADLDAFVAAGAATPASPTRTPIVSDTTPAAVPVTSTVSSQAAAPSPDSFVEAIEPGAASAPQMERRGVAVYVPEALARRFAAYCIEHDRDASELIVELIERHLEGQRNVQDRWLVSVARWARRKLDRVAALRAAVERVIRVAPAR